MALALLVDLGISISFSDLDSDDKKQPEVDDRLGAQPTDKAQGVDNNSKKDGLDADDDRKKTDWTLLITVKMKVVMKRFCQMLMMLKMIKKLL
ncbi:hypothetical protein MUCCIDRAFT_113898 [Mucor lusitanicus CBS 277.49]|uniref:Uncharacterized protein n=1 Tax=Mucor lusitanicus CBS 277.49 TaxID=747725 RepID=A0A168IVT1_MUCCL|nr:hypothetical protein MUCCIDRAFT_113898 [Mucor lusitanicus CBS 277.49]